MDPPSLQELARKQDELVRASDNKENLDLVMASRDLKGLQNVASRVMQKTATEVCLIGQGGFNMVFAIQFEDGSDIIARVHGSPALQDVNESKEELLLRIESEFATIRYLKEKTTIPVPEVLHLELSFDNSVGAPYTLQERIIGGRVSDMQDQGMSSDQFAEVVKQVARYEAQLLELSFDAIGSLMYDSVTTKFRVDKATLSSISLPPNRGPWNSTADYLHSLVSLQRSDLCKGDWIENRTKWLADLNDMIESPLEDINAEARADHAHYTSWFTMLEEALEQVDFSAFDPPNYPFVLVHDDLSIGNVFVDYFDPSCVRNIIDWEGSRVVPFWLAISEQFVSYYDLYDESLVARLSAMRLDILRSSIKGFPDAKTLGAMQNLVGLHTVARVKLCNLPVAIANEAVDNFATGRSPDEAKHFKQMMDLGLAYVNPQSKEMAHLLGW
ncbi:kinase-like domain-containing protein [Rhodocollybia butyracea]|uniref:Kinase-like domain-containing protein n=1 Tax=Rhodocollybia butyracea TaxID=206335 RepID=A0A9P5Q948_9AGAR|nr:kinase-like domain-containing protein [Rhodocollybia butyracea]